MLPPKEVADRPEISDKFYRYRRAVDRLGFFFEARVKGSGCAPADNWQTSGASSA